jgi:hypothetical protein
MEIRGFGCRNFGGGLINGLYALECVLDVGNRREWKLRTHWSKKYRKIMAKSHDFPAKV